MYDFEGAKRVEEFAFGSAKRNLGVISNMSDTLDSIGTFNKSYVDQMTSTFNDYQSEVMKLYEERKRQNEEVLRRRIEQDDKRKAELLALQEKFDPMANFYSRRITGKNYWENGIPDTDRSILIKKPEEFNMELAMQIEKLKSLMVATGQKKEDIEKYFREPYAWTESEKMIKDRLASIERRLTEARTNKSFLGKTMKNVAEGAAMQEAQVMLSNEYLKLMRGKPNEAELINDFIESHPEFQQEESGLWYTAFRGLGDFVGNQLYTFTTALEKNVFEGTELEDKAPKITGAEAMALTTVLGPLVQGVGGVASILNGTAVMTLPSHAVMYDAALAGATMGATKGMTLQMMKRETALSYKDQIDEGIDPYVASTIATGVGFINGMIEKMQLDTAFKGVPFISKFAEKGVKNLEMATAGKLLLLGADYVGNLTSESVQEVVQDGVGNLGMAISKARAAKGTSDEPLSTGDIVREVVLGKEAIRGYRGTFAQTMQSLALVGLLGTVGRGISYLPNNGPMGDNNNQGSSENNTISSADLEKHSNKLKADLSTNRIKQAIKVIKDKAESITVKGHAIMDLNNAYTTFVTNKDLIMKSKYVTPEECTTMLNDMDNINDVVADFIAESKKVKDLNYLPMNKVTIGDMILKAYDEGVYYKPMQDDVFNSVVVDLVKEANKYGIYERIMDMANNDLSNKDISFAIENLLPRSKRANAYMYINAVKIFDHEADMRVRVNTFNNLQMALEVQGFDESKTYDSRKIDGEYEKPVEVVKAKKRKALKSEMADIQKRVEQVNLSDVKLGGYNFDQRSESAKYIYDIGFNKDDNSLTTLYKNDDGSYDVVDGNKRIAFYTENNFDSVKANVIDGKNIDRDTAKRLNVVANIETDSISPIDVVNLLKDNTMDITDIDGIGGEKRSRIVGLYNLDNRVYGKVQSGKLDVNIGAMIGNAFPNDYKSQNSLYKFLSENNFSASRSDFISTYAKNNNVDFDNITDTNIIESAYLLDYANRKMSERKNFFTPEVRAKLNEGIKLIESDKRALTMNDGYKASYIFKKAYENGNKKVVDTLNKYADVLKANKNDTKSLDNFYNAVTKMIESGEIDSFGMSKGDYKKFKDPAYKVLKDVKTIPNLAHLYNADVNNTRVYSYDGYLPDSAIDKSLSDKRATAFIKNNIKQQDINKISIPLDSIMKNPNFNDVVFKITGDDVSFDFTRKELDKYEYRGLEEGRYKVNGKAEVVSAKNGQQEFYMVVSNNGADTRTFAEEVIHTAIYKKSLSDKVFYKEINNWIGEINRKLTDAGFDYKVGNELLTEAYMYKSFGFNTLDPRVAEFFDVPDSIVDSLDSFIGDDFRQAVIGDKVVPDVKISKPDYAQMDFLRGKVDPTNDRGIALSRNNLDTNSKAFKEFFKGSKVVDDIGSPLKLYGRNIIGEVEFFETPVTENTRQEVYLSCKNLYHAEQGEHINLAELKDKGYDGVEKPLSDGNRSFVILGNYSEQVCSVYDLGDLPINFNLEELKSDEKQRKTYGTVQKRNDLSAMELQVIKDLAFNDTYKVQTNYETKAKAYRAITDSGIDVATDTFLTSDVISAEQMAIGDILSRYYAGKNDSRNYERVMTVLGTKGTTAGQAVQYLNNVKKDGEQAFIKAFDNDLRKSWKKTDIEKVDVATANAKTEIKNINRSAVRKIDFDKVVESANRKIGVNEYLFSQYAKHGKEFDTVFNQVMGKTFEEIIDKGVTNKDIKNAKDYTGKYKGAINDVLSSLLDLDNNNVLNAEQIKDVVQKYFNGNYDKKVLSELMKSELDLTDTQSEILAKNVIDEIDRLTQKDKIKTIGKDGYLALRDMLSGGADFSDVSFRGEIAKQFGLQSITEEDIQYIKNAFSVIGELDNDKDVAIAMAKLCQDMANKKPVSWHRKLNTYINLSLLSGTGTALRNLGANTIYSINESLADNTIGVAVDSMMSMFYGGRRTTTTDFKGELNKFNTWIKEFGKGTNEIMSGYDTSFSDVDPAQVPEMKYNVGESMSTKTEIGKEKEMSFHRMFTFDSPVMRGWEKLSAVALQATDRASYQANRVEITNKLFETAKKNGFDITDQKFIDDVATVSHLEALKRTFNDTNKLSSMAVEFRNSLNKLGNKDFGLGDIVFKFPKTPSNLVMRVIDHTPVIGFINTVENLKMLDNKVSAEHLDFWRQREITKSITQQLNGGMLIGIGFLLRSLGVFTKGDDDDDKKMSAYRRSLGYMPTSVNMSALDRFIWSGEKQELQDGDKLMSYEWIEPFAMPIVFGSTLFDLLDSEEKDPTVILKGAKDQATAILFDIPMLKAMSQDLAYNNGDSIKFLTDSLSRLPSMLVPAFVNQIGQATDPTIKDTKDKNVFKKMLNTMLYRMPVAKDTLPTKVNSFGEELEFNQDTNTFGRFARVFLSPAKISRFEKDELYDVMDWVYKETGQADFLPGNMKNSFGVEKNYLTPDDLWAIQEVRNKMIAEAFREALPNLPNDPESVYKELKKISTYYNSKYRDTIKQQFENLKEMSNE